MQVPVQVLFHGLVCPAAIDALIRTLAAKTCRRYPRVSRCRVAIGSLEAVRGTGEPIPVHVCLYVPGDELVGCSEHADVRIAIQQSFAAAGMRLEAFARSMRLRQGKGAASLARDRAKSVR